MKAEIAQHSIPDQRIKMVATAGIRDAENREEVLNRLAKDGFHLQVLTEDEESKYVYQSILRNQDLPKSGAVVVEVGGGSTEIVKGTDLIHVESGKSAVLHAGSGSLDIGNPFSVSEIENARRKIQKSGFTGVTIVPDAFLVRAKDSTGNSVTMFVNPDFVTEFRAAADFEGQPMGQTATAAAGGMFATVPAKDDLSSKVVGLDVYNKANQDIGTIKDVAFNKDGVRAYIIEVGGFLGMGDHYVAVRPSAVNSVTTRAPRNGAPQWTPPPISSRRRRHILIPTIPDPGWPIAGTNSSLRSIRPGQRRFGQRQLAPSTRLREAAFPIYQSRRNIRLRAARSACRRRRKERVAAAEDALDKRSSRRLFAI